MANNNSAEKINPFLSLLNKYYKQIMVIISLAILIFSFIFWLRPQYLAAKDLAAQQIPFHQTKLAELDAYINDLRTLQNNLSSVGADKKAEFDKLAKILPNETGVKDLFAEMEALIENKNDGYNFDLKSLSFDVLENTEPKSAQGTDLIGDETNALNGNKGNLLASVKTVNISLTIEGGDYLEFKKLLGSIESHLRLLDVTSVNFGKVILDKSKNEKASYTLSFKTYYLP
jgi:hypothetical protein